MNTRIAVVPPAQDQGRDGGHQGAQVLPQEFHPGETSQGEQSAPNPGNLQEMATAIASKSRDPGDLPVDKNHRAQPVEAGARDRTNRVKATSPGKNVVYLAAIVRNTATANRTVQTFSLGVMVSPGTNPQGRATALNNGQPRKRLFQALTVSV